MGCGRRFAVFLDLSGWRGHQAPLASSIMTIQIHSAFDSGNITLIDQPAETHFRLRIEYDAGDVFFQWFHFQVSGARGKALRLEITGLEKSAYPGGWQNYRARMSYDRQEWVCAKTDYDPKIGGGTLTISVTPEYDNVWFAYFAPYSHERHLDLIARMGMQPGVRAEVLGKTIEGRAMDCLTLGDGPVSIWLYARQHPGESMAEWWMEGALEELTDPSSAVARLLRQKARFHIVPNMNPDGAFRGYLRTNAAGANLNREWASPTLERSPEVFHVLKKMQETGVDFALDVHGDEALPHNFVAGFEGIPSITDRQLSLYHRYQERLAVHSRDFQTEVGYPVAAAGKANLAMSTNAVAERFGAVAATLEMPFKDAIDSPEPVSEWSPGRAKRLGQACLAALADLVTDLHQ